LGLEVNVDYVAATAIDLAGRTVLLSRQSLDPGDSPLAHVTSLAQASLDRLTGDRAQVLGVAVAVPGLVDHTAGLVVTAPNLGWHDLPLRERLQEQLPAGCALRVDNDANVAAVAEATWGAARGCSPVLYLTGTVGLGAGLVVDGSLHRGAAGFAGEVGHAPIGGSDEPCACGRRGCWETTVGLSATLRAAGITTDPTAPHGDPVEAAAEVARLAEQDDGVAAALGKVARSLASGVVTLVSVLDPQAVVLGGYFVPLGPWLLPVVQRALADEVLAASSRRCTVVLSSLGLHAASLGAAADVLADVFSGEIAVV
jgi:predicted NBD/HSP70 family sugar kinase